MPDLDQDLDLLNLRPRPGCPTPAELDQAARTDDTTLPARLSAHLPACSACSELFRQMRANRSFVTQTLDRALKPAPSPRVLAAPDLPVPRDLVPGYDLLEELHRGGQGIVYRALQHGTKREVAIKMLLAGMFASERQRLRFEIESELAGTLRHPNIASVHDRIPLRGGRWALVMEYVRGVHLDLWQPDESTPALRFKQRLSLFADICNAVRHAHERGVIHRDLKPSNIIVDADHRPHLLDFGLAKALHNVERSLTMTGDVAWTLAYASPEQIVDPSRVDTRADIYSLGVLLYELLSGSLPYDTTSCTMAEAMERVRTEQSAPLKPREADAGFTFPRDTHIVVATALEKDPALRYQHVGALAADVRALIAAGPISARPHSTLYTLRHFIRRNRRWAAPGLFIAALILASAVGFAILAAQLAHRGTQLEASLHESRVRQARALTASGNTALGEQLLYAELNRTGTEPVTTATAWNAEPDRRRAFWGIAQVMAAQPCARTVRLPPEYRRIISLQVLAEPARSEPTLEVRSASSQGIATFTWPELSYLGRRQIPTPEPSSIMKWSLFGDERIAAVTANEDAIYLAQSETGPWQRIDIPEALRTGSRRADFLSNGSIILATNDGAIWAASPDAPARLLSHACEKSDWGNRRFAIDGSSLWVFACDDWSIQQRSAATGELLREIPGPPWPEEFRLNIRNSAMRVARGKIFIAGGTFWSMASLDTDTPVWASSQNTQGVMVCAVSDDAERLASFYGYSSPTIALWSTQPSSTPRVIRGHVANIIGVTWSPDARSCLSADSDGFLRVWYADATPWITPIPTPTSINHDAAWFDDGSVLVAHAGGKITRAHPGSVEFTQLFAFDTGDANALAIHPDGRRAATVGSNGDLAVIDLTTTPDIAEPKVRANAAIKLSSCAFSPDGSLLAVSGISPDVAIYDSTSLERLHVLQDRGARCATVTFSPDGRWLTWRRNHEVIVWDVRRKTQAAVLSGHDGEVRELRFSPDGIRLLSCADDRTVCVWRVGTWSLERRTARAREAVLSLAVHPSGRLAFGGDRSGAIVIWDLETGQDIATIPSGGTLVLSIECSPDGSRLLIATNSAGAMIWDLAVFASMVESNRPIADASPDFDFAPPSPER
jgi:eukaryotic-like serine/threonine-protein kinase